ncbi:clavesin-1 [Aedes aegypti]|uniref:CRAL-TRIO domain-containing protein n=1 Tax=Aedes aegypti TaxID=7159 RepID=A0A6I8TSH9_AEDAE|nr:clavesin-1 [Aedes aegypti]XP_021703686.1 clavesin-1 [Aedes aegypti]XP_021703687.1 clavesin-1 [Aedes aegypti]
MALRFDGNKLPYIDLGKDVHLKLDFTEYSDKKSLDKAQEELRETPEVVETALKELRVLLSDDKDLKVPIEDDAFLKKFLRPRKYYPESAYELLKSYHKMKTRKDFVMDNISTEAIKIALEERVVQLLPNRDSHGRRIIFLEMGGKWDCSKVPFTEMIRAAHALLTIASLEPLTQLNGLIYIVNFDKMKLSQLGQFSPKFVKHCLEYGQKSASMRVKAIHIINNAKVFDMLFTIFKPFIGKKWSQRILLHSSNMASLHKHVDQSCLPTNLEGSCEYPEMDGKVLVEFLEHYQDRYDALNSYGYADKS